ncbi:MAG: GNAT family N-acetyltransferase [Deltaproteobacteria bacterium]|nr:GNAT family N-acetyltransferase [Deltaproteobacteria bacterium]
MILLPLGRPDYLTICRVVDSWFGDPVSYLVHPVYREHFSGTSFVAREGGGMAGFLLGFVSQDRPEVAYAHLVCTDPARRRRGIGRSLYRRFFQAAIQRGCLQVTAITVPLNQTSISFHRSLGFMLRTEGAVREGDYPVMKDFAGPGIDCVVLERSLAEPLL